MDRLYRLACLLFHPFRIHISSWHPSRDEYFRVLGVVNERDIDTIIDVGANSGQFAQGILHQGFTGTIYSLEPQSAVHLQLQANARKFPNWIIADRCAIGDKSGELLLNISKNTYSSSIMGIKPISVNAAPATAYIGKEPVSVRRLDEWANSAGVKGRLFLKIDTQGYELKVLQGAIGLMPDVYGILVECSLVPLYENQPLFPEIVAFLQSWNFEIVDVLPGLRDPVSGRYLGMDLLAISKKPVVAVTLGT